MMRISLLVASAIALSACTGDQQSEAPIADETNTASQPGRPSLAGSEYDPLVTLRGLDPQWAEAPFDTGSNYSPSLGLDRASYTWRNTSLNYDRTDNGSVYMIQVRSGLPGRCDTGPDLARAFDQFAQDLALGEGATELRPKLIEAWASEDQWAEADIGQVMVRAVGGCPRALVLKAL